MKYALVPLGIALFMAAGLVAGAAMAQNAGPYPARPIRIVVPSAPGGGLDFVARGVSPRMSENLGQPIVIENRPGASGAIGAEVVAKAAPDGYTLLLADNGILAINPHVYAKLAVNPMTALRPVAALTRAALLLVVNPSVVEARNVNEFIAVAKRSPGRISFGSPGTGTPHRLAMELLAMRASVVFTAIPYNGSAPAIPDLLAGRIGAMFMTPPAAAPHVSSGRLVTLATLGAQRVEALPAIPTVAESGIDGFDASAWQMLAGPAGLAAPVVQLLQRQAATALGDAQVKKQMGDAGYEVITGLDGDQLVKRVADEYRQWGEVVRVNKLTPE